MGFLNLLDRNVVPMRSLGLLEFRDLLFQVVLQEAPDVSDIEQIVGLLLDLSALSTHEQVSRLELGVEADEEGWFICMLLANTVLENEVLGIVGHLGNSFG